MSAPALVRAPERRMLTREEAADYLGISTTMFSDMVDDGRMPGPVTGPAPKRSKKGLPGSRSGFFGTRALWDRWAIDQRVTDAQLSGRDDTASDLADVA